MENFIVIIAWIALIVSSAVFSFCAVAIIFKLKERKTQSEETSSAESDSPNSISPDLAWDSMPHHSDPDEISRISINQFNKERSEIAESIQKQFAEYSQSESAETSIDEPETVQFSQDASKELPVDHLPDSSQDGQEDKPETAKYTAANSG